MSPLTWRVTILSNGRPIIYEDVETDDPDHALAMSSLEVLLRDACVKFRGNPKITVSVTIPPAKGE